MPDRLSLLSATLLATACACSTPGSRTDGEPPLRLDSRGVDAFYAMVERLRGGAAPTAEEWSAFFDSPGYAQIDAVENRAASMEEWMELAFRPDRRDELERRLAEGTRGDRFVLANLGLAIEQRDSVAALIADLERPEVLRGVLAAAEPWLPEGAFALTQPPQPFLIVLDGDSKALPNSLVLDVVGLAVIGEEHARKLLAHELHHYFGPYDRVDLDAVPREVRPVVRLMERAETEGVADMIDKRELAFGPDGAARERQRRHPLFAWVWEVYPPQLAAAPEHVTELGELLEQVAGERCPLRALRD